MFESLIPETGNGLIPAATAELTPQDPNFVADNLVSQPSAYQPPTVGTELLPTPASIGIIDTGFNHWTSADRPDLTIGSDWVDSDRDPFVSQDTLTHGSAIAHTIGNTASLWIGRAVDPAGGNWAASLVEYTNQAQASGQKAIANLSFELRTPQGEIRTELTPEERTALQYAQERGVLIVVAAGHSETPSALAATAEFSNIIAVGALSPTGNTAADYSTPGVDLLAPSLNAELGIEGTSIATANVSRAAATLWNANPELSASQIAELLKQTATDLNEPGPDALTGYGALNLNKAAEVASFTTPDGSATGTFVTLTPEQLGLLSAKLNTSPLAGTGKFEIQNGKIYDPNGREFIAKGVNLNGPGFGWPGNPISYSDQIVNTWKFNAIRLNIQELQPSQYQYAENGSVRDIINHYTSKGVVVMIEPHENTGGWFEGRQLDQLVNWHRQLASEYKNNPYVWFNVSNEPGGTDSWDKSKWVNQNTKVVDAIRGAGNNNIIVLDDVFWGQGRGSWGSDKPFSKEASAITSSQNPFKQQKNILFSVHLYDQWVGASKQLADYFTEVQAQKLPIVLGEYGSMGDGTFQGVVQDGLKIAQDKEIGRFAWSWWGGDHFDFTKTGNGSNGGGQHTQLSNGNPTNLSWFGQQVWADNRRSENLEMMGNIAPTPTPTPTPAPTSGFSVPQPTAIPGGFRVQAENYSHAYDLTAQNEGGQYRSDRGVDIQTTSDSGGGHNVGWIKKGEWLEYDINVPTTGSYKLSARVASNATGTKSLRFASTSGQTLGQPLSFTDASGWQSWRNVETTATLQAGTQKIRVYAESNSFNFNYFEIVAASATPTPTPTPAPRSTIQVEAENMKLTHYLPETNWQAAGNKVIALLNSGSNTGEASYTWSGPSGRYKVMAAYVDENDGVSELSLSVGNSSKTWKADANTSRIEEREIFGDISLSSGTPVTFKGSRNLEEYARLDYLKFVPV
ncbi:MAG: cellulase family glycosylhydrolase [Desertifilum sp. SIO1I2]|nr:cellulase family glycosylhydrolase [Desertifilum sp. SIO1I2]